MFQPPLTAVAGAQVCTMEAVCDMLMTVQQMLAKMQPPQTVKSEPQGWTPNLVVDDGFVYRIEKVTSQKAYYHCWQKKAGCKGRCIISLSDSKCEPKGKHQNDLCRVEAFEREEKEKANVQEVRNWVCQRYHEACGAITVDELYTQILKRFVTNQIEGKHAVYVTPRQIRSWIGERPGEHDNMVAKYAALKTRKETGSNIVQRWLRIADMASDNTLIFVTDQQAKMFSTIDHLLIDGSFNSCPKGWNQYLNFMGASSARHEYFPLGHILMRKRDKHSYSEAFLRFLAILKPHMKEFDHSLTVITDFEVSLRDAVKTIFPKFGVPVRVFGCLFHFSQALFRKFRAITKGQKPQRGQYMVLRVLLFAPYIDGSTFHQWVKEMLNRDNPIPELFRYVSQVWLPRSSDWYIGPGFSRTGIYTNCALEGYHGRVNTLMGAVHPTLEYFAENLFQIDVNIISKVEIRRRLIANLFEAQGTAPSKMEMFEKNCMDIDAAMRRLIYDSPRKTETEKKEQSVADNQEEAQEAQYAAGKLTEDDKEKMALLQELNREMTSAILE